MKIKGQISANINRDNHTGESVIRIRDGEASVEFIEIKLTPVQFAQFMGGLGHVECEVFFEEKAFDKLGKKMIIDKLEFKVPKLSGKDKAREIALEVCPEGWVPDLYFGSQGSFFYKGGDTWARTTIRKWTDETP